MCGCFDLSYHSLPAPEVQAGGCLAPQTTSRSIEVMTVSASSRSMGRSPGTQNGRNTMNSCNFCLPSNFNL